MEKQKSVIIVGAGVGGVATAARLAAAGMRVTVVEQNGFTGGRCSLIHKDGYRFDQGPSLLLLPHFFREAFTDLGTSLEDEGVHLVKCEPNYNIHFHDGAAFQLSTDLATMKEQIERVEGKDGFERYLSFMQESHRHYELSVTHVLRKNFYSILSMARPSFLRHLVELHPFESIYSRASRYFRTERLRRVFTFASMYMGMSPFDAPGTYSLLQYTELAEGIWYPIGGFHKVVEAMVNIGKRNGVEYRLNTAISQIKMSDDGRRATGVVLKDTNECLTADIVVCNADLIYAYNNLLPETLYARSLAKREVSCSSISFYWALDRQFHELTAHNIFLASDYKESFDSIFKKHLIPSEPSFYVNVPSRVDPTAAPAGCDSIIVLVPVGHLLEGASDDHKGTPSTSGTTQDWNTMVSIARETILRTMQTRLNIDLASHIVHESVNTPLTWKRTFNLDRGAILGLSHSFFNVLCFRPKTKHPSIENLHFVGASTHPGTGVPIVLAGAKIVSEEVLKEIGERIPWSGNKKQQKRSLSVLDKEQMMPPLASLLGWVLMALIVTVLVSGGGGAVLPRFDWREGKFGGDW